MTKHEMLPKRVGSIIRLKFLANIIFCQKHTHQYIVTAIMTANAVISMPNLLH